MQILLEKKKMELYLFGDMGGLFMAHVFFEQKLSLEKKKVIEIMVLTY